MTYVDVVRFFERNCFFFFFANGGYESDFPYIFFFLFIMTFFQNIFFRVLFCIVPNFKISQPKKKANTLRKCGTPYLHILLLLM